MSSNIGGNFSGKHGSFSEALRPDGVRVAAFLRSLYPVKTAACVADAIGISPDTFRKWEAGLAAPGFAATLRMIAAFGPDFLAAVMSAPPAWLDSALRERRLAELEARSAALRRELDELSAG